MADNDWLSNFNFPNEPSKEEPTELEDMFADEPSSENQLGNIFDDEEDNSALDSIFEEEPTKNVPSENLTQLDDIFGDDVVEDTTITENSQDVSSGHLEDMFSDETLVEEEPPAIKEPIQEQPKVKSAITNLTELVNATAISNSPVAAPNVAPIIPANPETFAGSSVWDPVNGPPGIAVMSNELRKRLTKEVSMVLGLISKPDLGISRIVKDFVLSRDPEVDRAQRGELKRQIQPHLGSVLPNVTAELVDPILDIVYDELLDIGPIGPLWRDPDITEILVDAWDKIIVERNGILMPTNVTYSDMSHLTQLAKNLAQKLSNRAVDNRHPLVTAELPDARINFTYGSVVSSGLAIALRKAKPLMGIETLLKLGAISSEEFAFLDAAVKARATILISGGTGVGKTTIINGLSEFIPDNERVITIEDSRELKLANRFWLALQTKESASSDDVVVIDQEQLLINTLRMRPDRIIVGEVREGRGASTMLRAASTGHEGTMSTIHANSAAEALESFADRVREGTPGSNDETTRRRVAKTFDLVIQVTRESGKRFISEISVVGPDALDNNGEMRPKQLFTADLVDGEIVHKKVGSLDETSSLVRRMKDSGINPTKWV